MLAGVRLFRIFMRRMQGALLAARCALGQVACRRNEQRLVFVDSVAAFFRMDKKFAVAVAALDWRIQPGEHVQA